MRDLTVENFEEILRQQTFLFWYDSYHSSNKTHQLTNESANEIDTDLKDIKVHVWRMGCCPGLYDEREIPGNAKAPEISWPHSTH